VKERRKRTEITNNTMQLQSRIQQARPVAPARRAAVVVRASATDAAKQAAVAALAASVALLAPVDAAKADIAGEFLKGGSPQRRAMSLRIQLDLVDVMGVGLRPEVG
jgi:hypothetical protein